uniref:ATP synthase subunit a n=1 Tax=Chaunax penicillatus TaxID=1592441 RepID=Q8HM35_CHAPG|nr:ATPase subunit 6 [Chaunax penicillatus]
MTLSLFDQFMSPTFLGVPLLPIALLLPWALFPNPACRWLLARLLTLQNWFIKQYAKHLFTPLDMGGHKWALLFTSLMVFIMTLNLLGLLPYTFTPTTQLALTLGLAMPLWLMTIIIGLRNKPNAVIIHFLPKGTPRPLIPVLIIIETTSVIIRPLALAVRLMANLTAGHLMMQLIAMATLTLIPYLMPLWILTWTLLSLLLVLEVAVALIQAYVFVLLLSLYLQENI